MSDELLRKYIIDVPDFPKPGIIFKDLTPIFETPDVFNHVIQRFEEFYQSMGANKLVAIDARGFLLGGALAHKVGAPLVLARKPEKLPRETDKVEYALEYGTNSLEVTKGSFQNQDKVIIIDDLLATGGTAKACVELVQRQGGNVQGLAFVVELAFLEGRGNLGLDIFSLAKY